jgi:hypothetical protein
VQTATWPQIEEIIVTIASKITNRETKEDSYESVELAVRFNTLRDVYAMFHAALSGHNGCAEQCFWAAIMAASRKTGGQNE